MSDLRAAWREFLSTVARELRVDRAVVWLSDRLDRKDRR